MALKRTFLALVAVLVGLDSVAYDTVTISKADLGREFLLQTSYEQADGREDFGTSRSRIVSFERRGQRLRMVEKHRGMDLPDRPLACTAPGVSIFSGIVVLVSTESRKSWRKVVKLRPRSVE